MSNLTRGSSSEDTFTAIGDSTLSFFGGKKACIVDGKPFLTIRLP